MDVCRDSSTGTDTNHKSSVSSCRTMQDTSAQRSRLEIQMETITHAEAARKKAAPHLPTATCRLPPGACRLLNPGS